MKYRNQRFEKRRAFLGQVISAGVLGSLGIPGWTSRVMAIGKLKYPSGIQKAVGDVRVNGQPVQEGAPVMPGDTVTTGANSTAIFVVGKSVYLVRSNTSVRMGSKASEGYKKKIVDALRILNGKMLAVFDRRHRRILTPTAVAGIRGTGIYLEADPEKTYVCTCYGEVDLSAVADPDQKESVQTIHHESPRFIYASGNGAKSLIVPAPVLNHTDAELIMLEGMVWRRPPFAEYPGQGY